MKDLSVEAKQACLEIYRSFSKESVRMIGHGVIYAWNIGQHISKQPPNQENATDTRKVCGVCGGVNYNHRPGCPNGY